MEAEGRILHNDWDLYDTRHVVYQPARLSARQLEAGYWRAYREFYAWGSIFKGALAKDGWADRLRHVAYAGGWKKFEPFWDLVIRARRAGALLPVLEEVLSGFGRRPESLWKRFENRNEHQPHAGEGSLVDPDRPVSPAAVRVRSEG
jgi:hypothetical protein